MGGPGGAGSITPVGDVAEMGLPGLIDYHLHTGVTIDSKMTEIQACARAVLRGMQEIAFTNHIMLTEPDYTISPEAFVRHWENIQGCQERFPQLKVRLGLEMDYYAGREADVSATIRQYEALVGRPFDLVLGSVHHLQGVFFSSKNHAPVLYKGRDTLKLYRDYFSVATQAVRSQLFDVMAHPDLVKKYVGVLAESVPFEKYRPAVEPYVDALVECEVGIELNTKGYTLPVAEAYPSTELFGMYISRARAMGKNPVITLGSDAHQVEDVAQFTDRGAGILRKLGQTSLMRFENHRPAPIPLPSG